ncbi:hypothetical protein ACFL96_04140 [Thermoproteota archaeon]
MKLENILKKGIEERNVSCPQLGMVVKTDVVEGSKALAVLINEYKLLYSPDLKEKWKDQYFEHQLEAHRQCKAYMDQLKEKRFFLLDTLSRLQDFLEELQAHMSEEQLNRLRQSTDRLIGPFEKYFSRNIELQGNYIANYDYVIDMINVGADFFGKINEKDCARAARGVINSFQNRKMTAERDLGNFQRFYDHAFKGT